MTSYACFSSCNQYRYLLVRKWKDKGPMLHFIGLNPSTADGLHNDPTIKRCIGFGKSWGFAGVYITNLFAFRTPYPEVLVKEKHPVGPDNDEFIRHYIHLSSRTVLIWGNHGIFKQRNRKVLKWVDHPFCVKINKTGHPAHPLYLPSSSKMLPFRPDD